MEEDDTVKVVVTTGGDKVYMAGADLREMINTKASEMVKSNPIGELPKAVHPYYKKPIICAVSGFCLGGGLENVMASDIILANRNAIFGLPEITIALIPGNGGTTRFTRLVGKSNAMWYVLSGKQFSADEALRLGIISEVVDGDPLPTALDLASKIAQYSLPAIMLAKDSIYSGYESGLRGGLKHERQNFLLTLSLQDRKEALKAKAENRAPVIRDEWD